MELLPETIDMFVGYCLGAFGLGWGISVIFTYFKKFGEKI